MCEREVTVVCVKEVSETECAIGGRQEVANSGALVTLFDSAWLLWILMMIHLKSMVSSSYNHCYVQQ